MSLEPSLDTSPYRQLIVAVMHFKVLEHMVFPLFSYFAE